MARRTAAPVSAPATPGEVFAALLHELELGRWDPVGVGGDIFLIALPREPAAALAVQVYGGPAADGRNPYVEPVLLIRVRGEPGDAVGPERRAQGVQDALHGIGKRTLAAGSRLERCFAAQSRPLFVGVDDQGRHEWSCQFSTELRRPTANVP